jgi:hypothetical protein
MPLKPVVLRKGHEGSEGKPATQTALTSTSKDEPAPIIMSNENQIIPSPPSRPSRDSQTFNGIVPA